MAWPMDSSLETANREGLGPGKGHTVLVLLGTFGFQLAFLPRDLSQESSAGISKSIMNPGRSFLHGPSRASTAA